MGGCASRCCCCICCCTGRRPPDPNVRHYWHCDAVLIDKSVQHSQKIIHNNAINNNANGRRKTENGSSSSVSLQRHSRGLIYINNGKLCYEKSICRLHCVQAFLSKAPAASENKGSFMELPMGTIDDVNALKEFRTDDNRARVRPGCGSDGVVDIVGTTAEGKRLHVGILSDQADDIAEMIRMIAGRHKNVPKIFQFNSIDLDGKELDLP